MSLHRYELSSADIQLRSTLCRDEPVSYGKNIGECHLREAIARDQSGEHAGTLDLHIRFNRMMLGQPEFE